MFTAVTDVDEQISNDEILTEPIVDVGAEVGVMIGREAGAEKDAWRFTDSGLLQSKREEIVISLASKMGSPLVRKSRALYWNATRELRAACSISKRYTGKNQNPYWYAYHPAWDEFLAPAKQGFFILGCMDREEAYAIPQPEILRLLPHLHTTTPKEGKVYWHIHLREGPDGLEMVVPNTGRPLLLAQFAIPAG